MNNVVLMGRLTRDPASKSVQTADGEIETARFTVAVDRRGAKEGQTADFISCLAFRKQAEFVNKYLKKGTKVCLRGHIQTGSYTNKEGQTVYTTDVVAEMIEFAESKAAQAEAVKNETEDGFIYDGLEDEGLPFK